MIVEDRNIIEKATPIYSDIMSSNASHVFISLKDKIISNENKICSLREEANKLEEVLKKDKEKFNLLSKLFCIEYRKVDLGNKPETDNTYTGDAVQKLRTN